MIQSLCDDCLMIQSSNDGFFTDLCLERIIKLLSYGLEQLTILRYNISDSAFDELNVAIASSQLKQLIYDCYLTVEKAKSLAWLLTQTTTLDEVSIRFCRGFDCNIDVAKILVDAMAHSHVNKLNLGDLDWRKCSPVFLNLDHRIAFLPIINEHDEYF